MERYYKALLVSFVFLILLGVIFFAACRDDIMRWINFDDRGTDRASQRIGRMEQGTSEALPITGGY